MTLAEFAEDIWANDENRVPSSQYSYNKGGHITNTNNKVDISTSELVIRINMVMGLRGTHRRMRRGQGHCAPKFLDNIKIRAKFVIIWATFV